jgi:hypothetical protein
VHPQVAGFSERRGDAAAARVLAYEDLQDGQTQSRFNSD